MEKRELRCAGLTELRIDTSTEGVPPVIEGHAAIFDSLSQDLGFLMPFKERIKKGAFADSIKRDDIRALFNHDPNYVLGRNRAKTLTLKETAKGLLVRITPPNTQWARDLAESISRGDVTQMSFGFLVEKESWTQAAGEDIRTLEQVKLFDVSPVTFPAYLDTDVGVRSALDSYKRHKETEAGEAEKREAEFTLLKSKFAKLEE